MGKVVAAARTATMTLLCIGALPQDPAYGNVRDPVVPPRRVNTIALIIGGRTHGLSSPSPPRWPPAHFHAGSVPRLELRPWRNQLQGGRLRRWQQAERQ